MSNRAWVTLATNDSYGLGALVLAHSLRRAASAHPAVVLITPSVTDAMRDRLRAVFAEVVTVDVLDSRDAAHLALLQRPELGITFTKIHCWSLTQYEKCVFLDADTLVIQNCDELFEREELSAAPDVGWPDCFNSGVFVYKPSNETFNELIKFAQERGSFDGGDQGLLNSFFSDWAHGDINKHLPFLYNVTSAAFYSYLPALKHYGQDLKIIHFIGIAKPWLQQFNWESRTVDAPDHIRGLLQLWWDLFVGQVHSQLDVSMVEVQSPPELPPNDVSQHYTPIVDPESEFPWHHPDAQIQENSQKDEIDLSQFHNPWDIYAGDIPPNKEEMVSHNTFSGRMEDHEEMKKYAWEYKQQENTQHNYQEQYHHHFDYHKDTHSPHYPEQHRQSHSHDQSAHSHEHQTYEHHEQHEHNHFGYSPHHEESCHQQNSANVYSQQNHYHDHGHHYHNHGHHNHEYDHHNHHHNHKSYHPQDQHAKIESHHSYHTEHKQQHNHSNKDTDKLNFNRIELVHHVRLDHGTILNLHKHKDSVEKSTNEVIVNGDISDSESDYCEEIRMRHPYDGFYLRHTPTFDARGRKICSHEVQRPPSPFLDLQMDECNGDNLIEETCVISHNEEQSGVAGNLARVVPGSLGFQREALDELSRRQGWEAGNIDYMGADSFDNIWAKISQTLNQTRISPPKQPSPPKEQPSPPEKQPSPPKEQPKVEAPAPEPIEVTQEAVSEVADMSEASPPIAQEVKASAEVPAAEAPATPQLQPAAVAEDQAAPAVEVPLKEAEQAEAATVPAEPIVPSDIPVTVEAAAAAVAEPLVQPSDIPATVEAIAPGEAPQLIDAPASTENLVSEKSAVPEVAKEESKEKALPPTPPATPKSTPEASKPVLENAPTVEIQKDLAPAPVEAPAIPAHVEAPAIPAPVESSEVPASVAASASPVPVEAPKDSEPVAPVSAAPAAEAPASPEVAESKPEAAPASVVEVQKAVPVSAETSKDPIVIESKEESAPAPASPAPAAQAPASPEASAAKPEATPEKAPEAPLASSTDSPPLANTPSKEDSPALPAAKSEERRKAVGKLQLSPPAVADPLPTPDSELEDAATLAQSIIASEMRSPIVTPAAPAPLASPPLPAQPANLAVAGPQVPTPPVGAVSLSQIGVKSKPTIAAQIESSVAEKSSEPSTASDAPKDTPKKKIIKKVKKDSASAAGGEAPVPPPRKKEKKPKEK